MCSDAKRNRTELQQPNWRKLLEMRILMMLLLSFVRGCSFANSCLPLPFVISNHSFPFPAPSNQSPQNAVWILCCNTQRIRILQHAGVTSWFGTNLGSRLLPRIGCFDDTGTPSSVGLEMKFEMEFPPCSCCINLDRRYFRISETCLSDKENETLLRYLVSEYHEASALVWRRRRHPQIQIKVVLATCFKADIVKFKIKAKTGD